MAIYTIDEIHNGLATGKTFDPDETTVVTDAELKIADDASRTVRFRITTGDVDRANDVVNPKGWDVKRYKANPVVLFGHQHRDMPVARTIRLTKDAHGMTATAQFVPEDVPIVGERAEAIRQLIKGGFLNTASVGFRPLKMSFNAERGGVDFEKQELLEWSFVSVPMNAEASVEQRALAAKAFDWTTTPVEDDESFEDDEETSMTDDELRALCAERGIALADSQPVELEPDEVIIDEPPAAQLTRNDELLGAIRELTATVRTLVGRHDELPPDDECVFELIEEAPDEPTYEFDTATLGDAATAALQQSLRSIALDATRDVLNRARGRVD